MTTVGVAIVVALGIYWSIHLLRSVLTDTLNAAADRAVREAVRRLTDPDETRLHDSLRQIVCDGMLRASQSAGHTP
jgi:hypothetical protein